MAGADARLTEVVDSAIGQLPKDVPPDRVHPLRRSLEHKPSTSLEQAQESSLRPRNQAANPLLPLPLRHNFQP